MDGDQVSMGGGFGPSLRSMMTDQLQRRLALEDAREAREARGEEHRRAGEAAGWRERCEQAAAQQALSDGVPMADVLRGRHVGNTVEGFINKINAQQDYEDAVQRARQAANVRKVLAKLNAETSADVSDFEHESIARRAETDQMRPGVYEWRKRRSEVRELAKREAREANRADRRLRREGFGGL